MPTRRLGPSRRTASIAAGAQCSAGSEWTALDAAWKHGDHSVPCCQQGRCSQQCSQPRSRLPSGREKSLSWRRCQERGSGGDRRRVACPKLAQVCRSHSSCHPNHASPFGHPGAYALRTDARRRGQARRPEQWAAAGLAAYGSRRPRAYARPPSIS